jgi:DNA-binding MarR family transcriptional regulator
MDIEIDEELIHHATMGIDWKSFYPEIGKMLVSPSFYLMQAQRLHERKLRDLLVDFDLTETQFYLLVGLMFLTKKGEVITQMNLADFFDADKMLVSKVVRTLEKKKMVIRKKHPMDSRAKSLIVTEKGLEAIDSVLAHVAKLDEAFFSVIDNKDEFIKQLKKLS